MSILYRLKRSNKVKLLLNPLALITKRKYRPNKILEQVATDSDSFESVEIPLSSLLNNTDKAGKSAFEFQNPKVFCLQDGRVITDNVGSDCFITRNNELISEVTFSYVKGKKVPSSENLLFKRYFLTPSKTTLNTGVFSLLSGGGAKINYYHWFFDTLPRLKLLSESPYKTLVDKYLIANAKESYKLESLQYLGIRPEQLIESLDHPNIEARQIVVTTHPNQASLEPVPEWICQFLRTAFLPSTTIESTKRILISRQRASKRRIINEDRLFDELKKYNFERIFLEDLSFQDKVKVFSEANTVISPHGASLTNLVFSPAGAKVIEIFPPSSKHPAYKYIADIQGLDYAPYEGKSDTSQKNGKDLHADFYVEVDEIIDLIRTLD